MPNKQDAAYCGLDFTPRTPEEALEALKKIERMGEAYKPGVAEAVLRYFSVVTDGVAHCDYRQYLTGVVRGKMSVLAGKHSKSFVESWGYKSMFIVAINLMIDKATFYFKHKEKLNKNAGILEILEVES